MLKQVSLFAGLDAQTIEQLASITELRTYKAGQQVYAEGEADAALFIVISGTIRIDKQVNAEQQQTLQQISGRRVPRRDLLRARRRAQRLGAGGPRRRAAHDPPHRVRQARGAQPRRRLQDHAAAGRQLATLLRDMDEKFVELVGYVYGRGKK